MLKNQTEVLSVELIINTVVPLRKTGNPYKDQVFTKTSTVQGKIGKNYANEVSLVRPTDSTVTSPASHGRAWGTLVNPYVVEYKNMYYLQVFVENTTSLMYHNDKNEQIDESMISPWFPIEKSPQDVFIRDIKFSNIKIITLNGDVYKLVPKI
jgi:hypothetical protein